MTKHSSYLDAVVLDAAAKIQLDVTFGLRALSGFLRSLAIGASFGPDGHLLLDIDCTWSFDSSHVDIGWCLHLVPVGGFEEFLLLF